jgi:hypothetical protein
MSGSSPYSTYVGRSEFTCVALTLSLSAPRSHYTGNAHGAVRPDLGQMKARL